MLGSSNEEVFLKFFSHRDIETKLMIILQNIKLKNTDIL